MERFLCNVSQCAVSICVASKVFREFVSMTTISLVTMSQRYLKIFFICGQSSYNDYIWKSQTMRLIFQFRFFKMLPLLVNITLTLCTTFYFIFYQNRNQSRTYIALNPIFGYIVLASDAIIQIECYNSVIRYYRLSWHLMRQFECLETIFFQMLRKQICFRLYNRFYCIQITIVLSFLFISKCTNFLFKLDTETNVLLLCNSLLSVIVMVICLQFIFYVGLLKFFINIFLKSIHLTCLKQSASSHELIALNLYRLKCYKFAHLKLVEISQTISEVFGWRLVLFMLKNFADATITIYWIMTIWQRLGLVLRSLRNYYI